MDEFNQMNEPLAKKTGWLYWQVMTLGFVAIFVITGLWWVRWPSNTVNRFLELLAEGRINEARGLLEDNSAIALEGDKLMVQSSDGEKAWLDADQCPTHCAPGFMTHDSGREGFGDYLLSQWRCQLHSSTPAVRTGQKRGIVIHCIVVRGKITLFRLENK